MTRGGMEGNEMVADLRSFLAQYETEHPEDIRRVRRPLAAAYEVTALAAQLEKSGLNPVLLCEQVLDQRGKPFAFPVVTNLLSSRERCARILGCTFAEAGLAYTRQVRGRLAPTVLARGEAPVQAVTYTGDAVDLTRLPLLTHHAADPGPYITGGCFTSYEPESWTDNSALQRGWVKGPREIRVFLAANSHSRQNLRRYERQGRDMPCAFWVGHHPLAILAAQARKGYPLSHYETMGAALQAPLRLTPSVSLGDDFLVPADAEFVIEGYIQAGVRKPEGPFGEFTGYVGPQMANPVMTVTAVTHRQAPIWYDVQVGYAANRIIGGFALEAAVFDLLRQRFPSVQRVYAPLSGLCRYHVYVQLKNPLPGEAREAILAGLVGHVAVKHIFVFDDDVNIFDEREVLWAIATRTQWDRDLVVMPDIRGGVLDPSAPTPVTSAKGGLDCTVPVGKVYEERNAVPSAVRSELRLEQYIPDGLLGRLPRE